MFFAVSFLTIISHTVIVGDKMIDKFEYRLDDKGTILPPHFSLGLTQEYEKTYYTMEWFTGTDSIGEWTTGVGIAYGLYGYNDVFSLRVGGIVGGYVNHSDSWGKFNDNNSIRFTSNYDLVPMLGSEMVFRKPISESCFLVLKARSFLLIQMATFGIEWRF